ncbi:MATE family efflux transporter [Aureimonas jatrophae]|uniref:Multidrug-efflux transporter n=1 Tax=Aureimonas jatrophae TaxID=1166073 RepID=A0A1H0KMN8_9HYPH|nr:MATE family efflux transporter [Aureimonas jatrophae]MBB3948780.1 MATE family multidrug resistance protein [Aureimonas jatrophae]SDO57021.1 multidrug resistance protein, MATE family [Aureimonas jatrophae]
MTLAAPPLAAETAAPLGWREHARQTVLLGLPLAGAQLAQVSINVTNTVVAGQIGARELAAAVLGAQCFYLFWMFGSGFAYAVMPMAAAAHGTGDVRGVRRAVRMGLWIVALYSLGVMVPLWFAERILVALGQEPGVAAMAGGYVRVLQWAMLPYLAIFVFRSYFSALQRPAVVLIVTILGACVNVGLNVVFVFGHLGLPAMGLAGSGLATILTSSVMLLLLAFYDRWRPELAANEILVRFWRPDWAAFREVVRLGWPIGATIVAEAGLFTAAALLMGWIGTVELAAHGIALQLASISFMIPLGLAAAATVRVGTAFGQGDRLGVSRAARSVIGLATLVSVGAALLFWLLPVPLISLFVDRADPLAQTVVAAAVPLLFVAGAFQIVDSIQVVASGSLRGLKDTRVPLFIALFSYWAVGMPVASGLAFGLGWGGVGVWWGLAIGLAVSAVLMTMRFRQHERRGDTVAGA